MEENVPLTLSKTIGLPPTLLNARTGLLTPPGISSFASVKIRADSEYVYKVRVGAERDEVKGRRRERIVNFIFFEFFLSEGELELGILKGYTVCLESILV